MFDWQYSNYSKINPEVMECFPFKNPREGQLETISEIIDAINKGYKYIVLEAGTGTGKSAIAATLSNIYESSYILTITKQLQNQYLKDFNEFELVKGRSNFQCLRYADENIHQSCDEGRCILEGYDCKYSLKNSIPPKCRYYNQKYQALNAKTVIANYHYMFLELNYVEDFTKRQLMICDEAHNLESMLMTQLKLEFSKKELKEHVKYDLTEDELDNLNNSSYNEWIKFIKKIKSLYIEELEKIENISKPELLVKISALKQMINDCNRFITNISFDPSIWIIDFDDEFEILEFKPLKVDNYAPSTLFDYCDICLFMSATILDWKLFSEWLGIDEKEIYAIRRKTPFDTTRNPIVVSDKYNLSKSFIKSNASKTIGIIQDILNNHKNEKGIIHTVSSQCMHYLMDNLKSNRLIAHNTKNRAEVLEKFKHTNRPLVMVSPSMDEGVDLPGDECRFQIIYKIPYPDLGSKQVLSRINIDSEWYDYKTSLRLVQTHGRGMRFEDDYCKTYFIDNRLKNYVLSSKFIPDDFKSLVKSKIHVDNLVEKGDSYLKNNDYEKAILYYKDLIEDDIEDYRIYLSLAKAYHEISSFEDELNVIMQCVSSNPSSLKHFKSSLEKLESMGYFDFDEFKL